MQRNKAVATREGMQILFYHIISEAQQKYLYCIRKSTGCSEMCALIAHVPPLSARLFERWPTYIIIISSSLSSISAPFATPAQTGDMKIEWVY